MMPSHQPHVRSGSWMQLSHASCAVHGSLPKRNAVSERVECASGSDADADADADAPRRRRAGAAAKAGEKSQSDDHELHACITKTSNDASPIALATLSGGASCALARWRAMDMERVSGPVGQPGVEKEAKATRPACAVGAEKVRRTVVRLSVATDATYSRGLPSGPHATSCSVAFITHDPTEKLVWTLMPRQRPTMAEGVLLPQKEARTSFCGSPVGASSHWSVVMLHEYCFCTGAPCTTSRSSPWCRPAPLARGCTGRRSSCTSSPPCTHRACKD